MKTGIAGSRHGWRAVIASSLLSASVVLSPSAQAEIKLPDAQASQLTGEDVRFAIEALREEQQQLQGQKLASIAAMTFGGVTGTALLIGPLPLVPAAAVATVVAAGVTIYRDYRLSRLERTIEAFVKLRSRAVADEAFSVARRLLESARGNNVPRNAVTNATPPAAGASRPSYGAGMRR